MTWDDFLRVWAVLGPLLVGAIVEVWNRSVRRENQESEAQQREADREFEKEQRRETEYNAANKEHYVELKQSISEELFKALSLIYRANFRLDKKGTEEAYEDYGRCHQVVALLADEEVAVKSRAMFNSVSPVVNYGARDETDDYKKLYATYGIARAEYVAAARKFLKGVRTAT